MTSPNSATASGFSLKRLILIDSLAAGRIVEMPLDGGAVLTGRNGRGKTSMLQLLLLFFGESPNRLVSAESGRGSFVEYYLPRTTSYIVFEYRRPGDAVRQVALYADQTGERVCYRFIRHAFELGQFVSRDGSLVAARDLVKHLRLNDFQCADQQIESLTEFRAIIQAGTSGTRDRARQKMLREMSASYSFTPTTQPMPHIEKIIGGMFRRQTNFDDLQGMIVDCISEQTQQTLAADRRKLEDWPKLYKSMVAAMDCQPLMELLATEENTVTSIVESLAASKSKMRSILGNVELLIKTTAEHRLDQQRTLNTEAQSHDVSMGQITADRAQAKGESEFAESAAKKLDEQHHHYTDQNITEKAELVSRSQKIREDLSLLKARKEALIGAKSAISYRFDQIMQAEKEQFNARSTAITSNKVDLSTQIDAHIKRIHDEEAVAVLEMERRANFERDRLTGAQNEASAEHGRCQYAAQHPTADLRLVDLLRSKTDALDHARSARESLDASRRLLERRYRDAIDAYATIETKLSDALKLVQQTKSGLQQIEAFHAPQPDTLLHFLRTEIPQWTDNIGRVIKDDLLQRSDLSPALSEEKKTFYGLSLDLSKTEMHPLADPRFYKEQIETGEAALAAANDRLAALTADLSRSEQHRKNAKTALDEHELEVQRAAQRVQTARSDINGAQQQVIESLAAAEKLAMRRLMDAAQQLQVTKSDLDTFNETSRNALQEIRRRTNVDTAAHREKLAETFRRLDAELSRDRTALDVRLAQCDNDRNAALQAEGVDTVQLDRLEALIKGLNEDLLRIRDVIQLVQEYKHWFAHEWPKHETLLATAKSGREKETVLAKQIDSAVKAWTGRSKNLRDAIAQNETKLDSLNMQRTDIRSRIGALHAYPDTPVPAFDPAWTADGLIALISQQFKQLALHEQTIRSHVMSLQREFGRFPGTPPEEFLQQNRLRLSPVDGREWVAAFRQWFDKDRVNAESLLLGNAQMIAAEIEGFHVTLDDFHKRVLQFNRELQEHLDGNLDFDSITSVRVEIVSKIKDLKYWTAITDMVESQRAWRHAATTALPPPEFAQTIEQLLDHWEVKNGLHADFKQLIGIRGEVVENGNKRVFTRAADLEKVSSNGLSYLVLVSIFIAFLNRLRRGAPVNFVWALDELKDLDSTNTEALIALLARNNITLASAFPDPDVETLLLFKHRFVVEPDRQLATVKIGGDVATEIDTDLVCELQPVAEGA